nr:immunoglobulin light chain junction region [Macaca mulatta]MPO05835.1 immunoglobulin light chain junction region [Macaca mulatta]MPO08731.1 immunoglobulin light chain junction region [Macaca mulatta]MPO11179.1 immunoglobulin light chain junction region [Macaca mulatta]
CAAWDDSVSGYIF